MDNNQQNTPTEQQVSTTVATPEVKSKNKNILPIIIGLVVVVLIALMGVVYYLFLADSPTKIKSTLSTINPSFVSYSRAVRSMMDQLQEDSGSTADSIERSTAEGEDLLKEVKDARSTLEEELKSMKSSKLKDYKETIENYIVTADEAYEYEKSNINISKAYIKPMRDYEKLTLDISGSSNYLLSDPDKYVAILNNAITTEEKIKKEFEDIETDSIFGDMHNSFIRTLSIEISFLREMVSAAENRDANQIATATKQYTQSQQNNANEISRISDKLDKKVREMGQKLDDLKEDVDVEYNKLKTEFNI